MTEENESIGQALIEFAQRIDASSNHFANVVDINEFIANFEEVEPNFDQIKLIEIFKRQLADDFAAELSQCKDQQTTNKFVKSLKKSSKFVKWKQRTIDTIIDKAASLSVNMQPNSFRPRAVSDFNASDIMNSSSSWMSSSPYGQSTLFVGKNVLKRALNILENSSTEEDFVSVKIDVLHEISTMRSSDLASSEHWPVLQNVLVDLLDDQAIYNEVLRFLTKLFNSQTHTVVVDVFLILLRNLEQFCSSNHQNYRLVDGLNVEDPTISAYLSKFRLFHACISSFPSFWIRYSDELVSNVVEKTVKFLSLCDDSIESALNPILIFALFDSEAKWLSSWMYSTFSSVRFVNATKDQGKILTFSISVFLEHVTDAQSSEQRNSRHSSWTLPSSYEVLQLKSLLWSQTCRMLSILSNYPSVRCSLFPVKYHDNELHFQLFFVKFIRLSLNGDVKNISDIKFLTAFLVKLSSQPTNHYLFQENDVIFSLIGVLADPETHSNEIRTAVVQIFSEMFLGPKTFQSLANLEFGLKTGEKTTLLIFVVVYCSKIVNLAWQKDPDAPLNSVYAAVRLCQTICRYHEGRDVIYSNSTVLQDVVRLARDKTLSGEIILPLLTACERRNGVKKFLYNSMNFSSRSTFLWSTPLDFPCGNLVQKFAEFVRIVAKSVSSDGEISCGLSPTKTNDDTDQIVTATNDDTLTVLSSLFSWFSNPSALGELLRNETFVDLVDASFAADESGSIFVLALIRTALCNLEFVNVLRQRTENGRKIQFVLERLHFTDDKELRSSPHSLLLLDIYVRQKGLAGPNERLRITRSESTNLDEFFDSNCFRAEPSCFIAKPSSAPTSEVENQDFLNSLLTSVASKQRISHSDLLWRYLSTNFRTSSGQDRISPNRLSSGRSLVDSGWNLVLEYGENLKLYDDVRKTTIELKNVLRHLDNLGSSDTVNENVDWFVGVVFLMNNGKSSKTVQFLNIFSENVAALGAVWPGRTKNYREIILRKITPFVEKVCERDCPVILECLNRSGIALSNLLLLWFDQCFVNFLDYPEIVNFVSLSVLGGLSYQTFFCCCILKHLSSVCPLDFHRRNLPDSISEGYNFRLYNYVKSLQYFRETYEF